MGSHSLLQGIFLIQGSKLSLLHCRQILCQGSLYSCDDEVKINLHDTISGNSACLLFFFNFLFYIGVELINRRRQWQATPVLLPGESHGQRSLVGCSPWGYELDMTERLHFHFSLSCIGEGNGNPLQCSCLENPRDGGA